MAHVFSLVALVLPIVLQVSDTPEVQKTVAERSELSRHRPV